jgi:hypothetical protein
MSAEHICILILVLATLFSTVRFAYFFWRQRKQHSIAGWRMIALLLLPVLSAGLLYCVLFPPKQIRSAQTLTVLTAGASYANISDAGRVVALPESPSLAHIERVPDLATALRLYPDVDRIRLIGAGLSARDQHAAREVAVEFQPLPLPRGVIELHTPTSVSSGAQWSVSGRVHQIPNAHLELRDPANTVVARMQLKGQDDFVLSDNARSPGLVLYQLRVMDERKRLIETVSVPVHSTQVPPLKIKILSGGPNAELKYLRRWAVDAGIAVQSEIELGAGMSLSTPSFAISTASLREVDLLVLDERAWSGMSSVSKRVILEALRNGMGLMLRITGPLNNQTRGELRTLGFAVSDARSTQGVRLLSTDILFNRQALSVRSSDAVSLWHDDKQQPLALWRNEGRGRFGLAWLTDTHKLVLNGYSTQHGQLWGDAVSTLSRAHVNTTAYVYTPHAWIDQRTVLCNISPRSFVQTAQNEPTYLLAERNANKELCAAYWPRAAGWHRLVTETQQLPFYVRDISEARALHANQLREVTLLLSTKKNTRTSKHSVRTPGSAWPWFFAWLTTTGLLWWLERSVRSLSLVHSK